ncbi:MAG: HlyC/CorC family transporter [Cyanobacteria bacterium SZAS TMP-1]|nr:HlyC/CorC family transporter [Cyanobacteria bacterium SZAS TMP-1]
MCAVSRDSQAFALLPPIDAHLAKETKMATHSEVLLIGLLLVFIVLNGLFVAAEYSLIRLRRSRVAEMIQLKIMGARTIASLQETMDRSVAGAQLGITISGLAVGGVGQEPIRAVLQSLVDMIGNHWSWFANWHVPSFVGIFFSFLILTMMHVIIGEQVPKLLSLRNPEKVALRLAMPFFIFCRSTAPLLTVINGITSVVLRLLRIERPGNGQDTPPSVEELQILIEESRKAGQLAADETNILSRVLELRGLRVRDVMMPLTLVDGISEDMPLVDALEIISQTRHSRLPIFRGGRQSVVGILNSRELLDLFKRKLRTELKISRSVHPDITGKEPIGKLSAFIRKPYFVSENMSASDLLVEFGKRRLQLAIVMDEERPTEVVGLITQEDLLEQLVGEIVDEWDKPIAGVEVLDGVNCYRIDGELTLYELRKVLDVRLTTESDDFTVAAAVRENLALKPGRAAGAEPAVGDFVDLLDFRFTVQAVKDGLITRVDVCPVPPSTSATGEEAGERPDK